MNLGTLIKRLEFVTNQDALVVFDFEMAPTTFASYRGYYDHLAIGFNDSKCTVAQLLQRSSDAIGATFSGWKGGYYTMGEHTPVWVDNPGDCSSRIIVDVNERYGESLVTLSTLIIDDYA